MVINDFRDDGRRLIAEKGETFASLGEKLDVSYQSVQKWCNVKIPDGYVRLMEALGYDIKVEYVSRRRRDELENLAEDDELIKRYLKTLK